MSFEFPAIRFADTFKVNQRNGLTKPKSVRGAGLPMVNMGELFAHSRIRDIDMDKVPVSEKEKVALLQPNDLLFARQSLVLAGAGQCSIFLGHRPTVFESHLIRCRLDEEMYEPKYYYYFFKSSLGRKAIRSIVEQGAAASGIKGSDLIELEVPAPPLQTQKLIANFFDNLDSEIENLHHENTALESIAQRLFRSWFVNFDPVHAKAAGKEPEAMLEELAALFPSEFENSELGPIPKGWLVSPYADTVEILSGGTPKTSVGEYWNGDIPWFSVTDAPVSGQVFVLRTDKHITKAGLESSPAKLLPSRSTIISARGTVGKIGMVSGQITINQSCYALSPKNDQGVYWVYFQTRNLVSALKQMAHGGVFDTITRDTFKGVKVVIPPKAVFDAFSSASKPLFDAIECNGRLVLCLKELRDHLLPRLISGKLNLEEAEQAVKEATVA